MSSTTQRPSPSAVAHAKALLELADERKQTPQVAEEMAGLAQALADAPDAKAFFNNPGISGSDRTRVLQSAFLPKLGPLTGSFLQLLNSRDKLGELPGIAEALDQLLDERLGKVEVDLTVARKLGPQELDMVRQRISTAIKKEAVVHQYVDESILGGIIIRVGDTLIDGSVKSQLDEVKQKLLNAK